MRFLGGGRRAARVRNAGWRLDISSQVGPSLWSVINEKIIRNGPIPFSEFQDLALYHPQSGFYSARGSAGRTRDFLTSPEVGGLFARVLSNALDRWWRLLGRPNPFFVFEAGAGTGTLAANVLELQDGMRCGNALRYIAVERSATLRNEQAGKLQIQSLENVLTSDTSPSAIRHPLAANAVDLPSGRFTGVILANELLDNLPVDLYERRGRHWCRVLIGLNNEGGFEEILDPLDASEDEETLDYIRNLASDASDGTRLPLQRSACDWLERAIGLLEAGRVVLIDYYRSTQWMLSHEFSDWCRTYRGQRPGTSPLDAPGTQDITCEVAIDQLSLVRKPNYDRSQADFLEDFGLSELVGEARQVWHSRAAFGDLASLRARAKVQEGRALTDIQGLGRYRVLEWIIGEQD